MATPLKLNDEEIAEKLIPLPDWKLLETMQLGRTFSFADKGDFRTAIAFVNEAANVAEDMQHHPDIDIRYSKVTCFLSTHDAGGISELDFVLAAKLDAAFVSLTKTCD
jgi:4a-hydroxytetrahydrobiopterin dehydratase